MVSDGREPSRKEKEAQVTICRAKAGRDLSAHACLPDEELDQHGARGHRLCLTGPVTRRAPDWAIARRGDEFNPSPRQLFLHGVLAQTRTQAAKIDQLQRLILIGAAEDDGLLPSSRIAVNLQALAANFLHHALHR